MGHITTHRERHLHPGNLENAVSLILIASRPLVLTLAPLATTEDAMAKVATVLAIRPSSSMDFTLMAKTWVQLRRTTGEFMMRMAFAHMRTHTEDHSFSQPKATIP